MTRCSSAEKAISKCVCVWERNWLGEKVKQLESFFFLCHHTNRDYFCGRVGASRLDSRSITWRDRALCFPIDLCDGHFANNGAKLDRRAWRARSLASLSFFQLHRAAHQSHMETLNWISIWFWIVSSYLRFCSFLYFAAFFGSKNTQKPPSQLSSICVLVTAASAAVRHVEFFVLLLSSAGFLSFLWIWLQRALSFRLCNFTLLDVAQVEVFYDRLVGS